MKPKQFTPLKFDGMEFLKEQSIIIIITITITETFVIRRCEIRRHRIATARHPIQ